MRKQNLPTNGSDTANVPTEGLQLFRNTHVNCQTQNLKKNIFGERCQRREGRSISSAKSCWTTLSITILKSIDHNFELEQDLEAENRRLSIIVSNSGYSKVGEDTFIKYLNTYTDTIYY